MPSSTLILNQGYQPISTRHWRKALALVLLGKAEVLEEYEEQVWSVEQTFRMPAVIRITHQFRRHRKMVKFSRTNVLARDKWTCQYCGQKMGSRELTYDHVYPKSKGGETRWENIVMACTPCQRKKGSKTVAQSGMRPLKTPIRPEWLPIFSIELKPGNIPVKWAQYIYWNVGPEE
jgi:5-methylcytosine-specific restriction endonuclease McrA